MKRSQPHVTVAVPISALVLAASAAVSFEVGDSVGFISAAAEGTFIATWLLGWVLLVWAAIIGGAHAVLLVVRLLSKRPVSQLEASLVAASFLLITAVLVAHPLWGTGSAGTAQTAVAHQRI